MAQPPSPSTPTDIRHTVSTTLDPRSYKIYATASARVYHSHFGAASEHWSYSRLKGILVFGRDRLVQGDPYTANGTETEKFWFRLIDDATGKILWMFKVPINLEYRVDRPFFHVFPGRSRMFGFRFDDDDEATSFSHRVLTRVSTKTAKPPRNPKKSKTFPVSKPSQLSPSMISGPTPDSFVHVAHVGINESGMVEASEGLDPVWVNLVGELQGYGISQTVIEENLDFVEGYLAGAKSAKKHSSKRDHKRAASGEKKKKSKKESSAAQTL